VLAAAVCAFPALGAEPVDQATALTGALIEVAAISGSMAKHFRGGGTVV